MEHVSTSPKVTVTTMVVGRGRFSGYERSGTVLSGESRIPDKFMFIPPDSMGCRPGCHRLDSKPDLGGIGEVPFPAHT